MCVRLSKACVYDMPTCYYQEWVRTERAFRQKYADRTLPGETSDTDAWFERKRPEMELADLRPSVVADRYLQILTREQGILLISVCGGDGVADAPQFRASC